MRDPDCDRCYPENHQECKGRPYNGAAPMSGSPSAPTEPYDKHRRCAEHQNTPP